MTDEEYANDPIPEDDAQGVAEPVPEDEQEDDPTVSHEPVVEE